MTGQCEPNESPPPLGIPEGAPLFECSLEELAGLVRRTDWCTSDEVRPELECLHCQVGTGKVLMQTADGIQAVRDAIETETTDSVEFLVWPNSIAALKQAAHLVGDEAQARVWVQFTEDEDDNTEHIAGNVVIAAEGNGYTVLLRVQTLDLKFPDVASLFAQNAKNRVEGVMVSPRWLALQCQLARALDSDWLKLVVGPDKLLHAVTGDTLLGKLDAATDVEMTESGGFGPVYLQARLLARLAGHLKADDRLHVQLGGKHDAVLFACPSRESFQALLMPMNIET